MSLDNKTRQAKRAEGQKLSVSVQVGKGGINDALIDELKGQLKRRKLVKVRLLPSATDGGNDDVKQAEALAEAVDAHLIERRGHTALLLRK